MDICHGETLSNTGAHGALFPVPMCVPSADTTPDGESFMNTAWVIEGENAFLTKQENC